jgi:hypothetical protein
MPSVNVYKTLYSNGIGQSPEKPEYGIQKLGTGA